MNLISKQEYKRAPYSDKKIKAKYMPEYSVLKPETNSDSASLKSKGARWVSARAQINQTGKMIRQIKEFISKKERIEKEETYKTNSTRIVLRVDS
jgi:hypothetical protein